MKEGANGVLASLTPLTYRNSMPQSFARCGLVRDPFDQPGGLSPSEAGDLLSLGGALGGMLKHALGAGIVNELAACDQTLGHGDLAPGAETFRQFSGRCGRIGLGCRRISHGRHSR